MIHVTPSEAVASALASVRISGLCLDGSWTSELRDAADRDLLQDYCRQLPIRIRAIVRGWPDPFPWSHNGVIEKSEPIYDVTCIARLNSVQSHDWQEPGC